MSSNHIILDALEAAVYERIGNGTLDADVLDNVPQSHTFYPSDGDVDYYDEDSVAAVRAVGDSDVLAKINFYRQVLDR